MEGYSAAQKEKQPGIILGLSQAQLQSTYAAAQPHGEAWAEGYTQAVNEQMNAFEDVELGMQGFDGVEEANAAKKASWASRHGVALAVGAGVFLAAAAGFTAGLVVVLRK